MALARFEYRVRTYADHPHLCAADSHRRALARSCSVARRSRKRVAHELLVAGGSPAAVWALEGVLEADTGVEVDALGVLQDGPGPGFLAVQQDRSGRRTERGEDAFRLGDRNVGFGHGDLGDDPDRAPRQT